MIGIKLIIKIMLGLLCAALLFITFSWANHRLKTNREIPDIPSKGKFVEVNGYRIHVLSEGAGPKTLVFMAGSGTGAPALDFKPLWAQLTGDYRIVVVERAGYGFSDVVKGIPRDIDSTLEEYRQALKLAGEMSSPFVLVAHSMSALDAIYWANQHPDEVEAIIGLDPAVPEVYKDMDMPPLSVLRVLSAVASLGVTRFMPSVANSPVIQSGYLSDQEKEAYKELIYRRTLTSNMLDEIKVVVNNAEIVKASGVPVKLPMLFFVSNGKETGVNNWRELLVDYAGRLDNGSYLLLDVGHYLHHYEPAFLVDEMKIFLGNL